MTVISLEERLAKELAGRPLGCTEGRADDIAEEDGETLAELGHMRVVAQGRLSQHSYQVHDGSNRTVMELTVDEIGPSLRYATAQVTKQGGHNGYQGGSTYGSTYGNPAGNPPVGPRPATAPSQPPATDPWANGGSGYTPDTFTTDAGEPEF